MSPSKLAEYMHVIVWPTGRLMLWLLKQEYMSCLLCNFLLTLLHFRYIDSLIQEKKFHVLWPKSPENLHLFMFVILCVNIHHSTKTAQSSEFVILYRHFLRGYFHILLQMTVGT